MRSTILWRADTLIAIAVFGIVGVALGNEATTNPTTQPATSERTIKVSGRIVTKEKKGAENIKVFLCHKKAGVLVLEVSRASGKLAIESPSSVTSSTGEFVISAPLSFIDYAPQRLGIRAPDDAKNTFEPGFTLAVSLPESPNSFMVMCGADGKFTWFKIDSSVPTVDLKEFCVNDTAAPPTWVFRYPNHDIKGGGEIIFDHSQ